MKGKSVYYFDEVLGRQIFPSRRKGRFKKFLTQDQTILTYFQVKMEATSYTTMLSMWGSIPTRALKMGKTTMQKLHKGCITVTYWCDNNTVVFMDNDVPSGKAHWTTMDVRSRGDFEIMHAPLVALLYKKVRGKT